MSDLVGNPEDRFSHNEAHIIIPSCTACPSKKTTTYSGHDKAKQYQYSSVMSVRISAGGYLAAHQFFQDLMSGEGGIMVLLTYNKSSQYTNELRISTRTM